jgi:hypothetical protein
MYLTFRGILHVSNNSDTCSDSTPYPEAQYQQPLFPQHNKSHRYFSGKDLFDIPIFCVSEYTDFTLFNLESHDFVLGC